MNLNKLMKQAQKMQEQMAKTQAELEEKTVEVSDRRGQSESGGERSGRCSFDQDRQGQWSTRKTSKFSKT